VIVDVHAHLFPPDFLRRVEEHGGALPRLSAAPLSSLSLAERVELMDRVGVDLQVLSVGVLQPYYEDPKVAVDLAKQANECYLETCETFAGRFATFIALPLPHLDAALAELDRLVGEPRVAGVAMSTSVLGRQLDDPVFAPLYAELDRRALTVFLHPTMLYDGFGPNSYGMDRSVGAMFEDTIAAVRLLLSGVLVRNPRLRIIVPHLGGTLPFIHGRIASHVRRAEDGWRSSGIAEGSGSSEEGVRRLFYDTAMRHAPALRCACDTVGHDRLVFGTDFPYVKTPEEFADRIEHVRGLPVPEDAKAGILGATAAGLLGLALPESRR
jgi:predicted TIM-barrel fold metal-dependent hydrolase